jgi:hypothetical protein
MGMDSAVEKVKPEPDGDTLSLSMKKRKHEEATDNASRAGIFSGGSRICGSYSFDWLRIPSRGYKEFRMPSKRICAR